MQGKNPIIEQLRQELPPVWARVETDRLTGGMFRARTLANLQSRGEFPSVAVNYIGRKAIILRDPFLEWAETKLQKKLGAAA